MSSNAVAAGGQPKDDDPMKQTILIIEHKIRNLEKRKLKLEGYLQLQRDGVQLSSDQLLAASKFNEVVSTLDFARNLKQQLSSLLTSTKQKKQNIDGNKPITKVDSKIKEVLIFQNILENIKDETVKQDLLTGNNGAVQLTHDELAQLSHFSKMVSPKRRVEEGKPLFEDQLKTVSKHYLKLIESKSNIVAGTSYASLKENLMRIEKSGYLDCIIKKSDHEGIINNEVSLEANMIETVNQPIISNNDHNQDNMTISSVPNVEFTPNKIETIYFTNNNIGGNVVEQKSNNRNPTDSVFNTSFDFLQDSQLEDDHISDHINSIPTQTFSSSVYSSNKPSDDAILEILNTPPQNRSMRSGPYKETKLNHLENIVNVSNSNSWSDKSGVNWQNRVPTEESNNLPRENWSMAQMMSNSTNSDWLIKNNWVQMAEADKQSTAQPTGPSQKNSTSNYNIVSNGYTDNLNELLQKSVVFNKQEQYPDKTTNSSSLYQNNYQQSPEHNIGHYNNSSNNSYDRNQANDFNKRSASSKPKVPYLGEGGSSRGYQQGNSYIYNNRSYKSNSNSQYHGNANNDYSRISRQT